MKVAEAEKKHAVFAPSAAKRHMACLPSILYDKLKGDGEESEFAKEGTRAHKLMEEVFKAKDEAGRLAAMKACDDEEMREHIADLYDKVQTIIKKIKPENVLSLKVESKVALTDYQFGTLDIAILYVHQGMKKIYILDLKYGRGVPVPAEENPQLMIYAIAAEKTFDWVWQQAVIAIYQPRNKEHSEPLDQWVMSAERKKQFIKENKTFHKDALQMISGAVPQAKMVYTPGAHCNNCFCPGRALCKPYAQFSSAPGLVMLDSVDPLPLVTQPALPAQSVDMEGIVKTLTDEQLAMVIERQDLISKFCEVVNDYVTLRIKNGRGFPGWKLVAGRKSRKWLTDKEDEIAKGLQKSGVKDPWNRKLRGITDIEREVKKIDLSAFVQWTDPKPKLVRESDPRSELANIAATNLLDDLPLEVPEMETPKTAVQLQPTATTKPKRKVWVNTNV